RGPRTKSWPRSRPGSRLPAELLLACPALRCQQVGGAVGAELVGLRDFALAVGAGGMQVALAVGAEVDSCAGKIAAARTGIRQRLAHQQINDESDEQIRGRKNQNEKRPEPRVHVAALGVAIDVAYCEKEGGHGNRHARDNSS